MMIIFCNTICGEKIAIVSNKPQTTRNRITGILTKDKNQYVFLDTPEPAIDQEYYQIEETISPEVLKDIVDWIKIK